MQSVPNYQVIEFLEWIKRNQRQVDINSDKLNELAKIYLSDYRLFKRTHIDLRFILEIFQLCPQIREMDIIREMEHFARCGECIHYIFRKDSRNERYFPRITLHPLLERFLIFLHENDSRLIDSTEKYFENIDSQDEIHHFFTRWIRKNGEDLFINFKRYIENVDRSIIHDFEYKFRGEHRYLNKNREDTFGEINISEWGFDSESRRLVDSVRFLLSDDRNLQNLELLSCYSKIFKDELSKTLEFFNWIIAHYPKLNLTSDIPSSKINELIDQFCEEYSYSDVKSFKKQIEKIFRGEIESNLLNKIRKIFSNSGTKIGNQSNPFDRYNQMNFHGIFLFPNFGSSDLVKFIDESWQDLNSLTGDWIDIYFSKDDIRKRNGFDILKDFKSFDNIKLTDLPSFIIWDNSLKNALALPLSELSSKQILLVIQHIVQSIREGNNLRNVANAGLSFINEIHGKKLPKWILGHKSKKIQYINIMGDNFEIKNANDITIINKSKVEKSFTNKVNNNPTNTKKFWVISGVVVAIIGVAISAIVYWEQICNFFGN